MASEINQIQKGKIHFRWQGGKEVTIACTVENETVVDHDAVSMVGLGELESVEVNYGNNETHPLCLECQTHLIKSRMVECPEGSSNLEEVKQCLNPECPSQA